MTKNQRLDSSLVMHLAKGSRGEYNRNVGQMYAIVWKQTPLCRRYARRLGSHAPTSVWVLKSCCPGN